MSQFTRNGSGGSGGSGIQTIAADQGGSVVGPNTGMLYSGGGGSTTYTYVAGNQIFINATDADSNTLYGLNSGGAFGQQSGNGNSGFGESVLPLLSTGSGNTIIGWTSGSNITTQNNNVGLGSQVLGGTGSNNIAIGANALQNTDITGSNLLSIGYLSGLNYGISGEQGNILLGGVRGTLGESNVMRLGNDGSTTVLGGASATTKTVIWGINGASGLGTTATVVIDTSTGQLGTATGGGGLTTLTADSGVATESSGNIDALGGIGTGASVSNIETFGAGSVFNIALKSSIIQPNTNGTGDGMYGLGSTTFMHNFGQQNTFLGANAGNLTLTSNSTNNTAIGFEAGLSINDFASNCVYVGSLAGRNLTDGFNTVAIGTNSLGTATTTVNGSTSVGVNSLAALTSGSENTAIGYGSLGALLTGTNNIALGNNSGQNYVGSESSNLLIGNDGVASENNTMRLGTTGSGTGQVSTAYIAAVAGVSVANAVPVYIDSTTGQLGTDPGSWTAFTPSIEGETSAGSQTYSSQLGKYIRNGNTITIQFSIAVATMTGTGNMLITGLPFTIDNSPAISPVGSVVVNSLALPASTTYVQLFGVLGTTNCRLISCGSATAAAFVQMPATAFSINGTLIYEV